MKYWPLTAVLLAFWLGRETGVHLCIRPICVRLK